MFRRLSEGICAGTNRYSISVQFYRIFQWTGTDVVCYAAGTGTVIPGSTSDVLYYEYSAGCKTDAYRTGGTECDDFWYCAEFCIFDVVWQKDEKSKINSHMKKEDAGMISGISF